SRIENLTKVYGSRIAVSETTVLELKDHRKFHFRFLDRVRVKGKTKPVAIYEIFDGDEAAVQELKHRTLEDYSTGVKTYFARDWDHAREAITKVLKINPQDKAAQLYELRLASASQPAA
ncbi:MAG: guanylate cyclase, partial [Leptospiraceae bacterium]|nr:guanylate cyclase [Leptospiraceae bacterium]